MGIRINYAKNFSATKADLVHTHSEVENVKKELNKLKGDFFIIFVYKRRITENLK
jgi:hypothetical protein